MTFSFTPFSDRSQDEQELRQVDSLYFEEKGGLTPLEMPEDIQELEKLVAENELGQQRVQVLIQSVAKRIAKERGIKFDAALELLFKKEVPDVDEGETALTVRDKSTEEGLFDLMTIEETNEFLSLGASKAKKDKVERKRAIYAATLFIRHRIAYDVHLVEAAEAKSAHLKISPAGIGAGNIQKGQQLRFGDTWVKVVGATEDKGDYIHVPVFKLSVPIEDGAVGFICVGDRYRTGIKAWTKENTEEYLLFDLIQQVYQFHREEAAGVTQTAPAPDSSDEAVEEEPEEVLEKK